MYSRAYGDQEDGIIIPDSYSGTAISAAKEDEDAQSVSAQPKDRDGIIPLLAQTLKGFGLGLPKIGMEELLIIGVAALLLFSKEKDIECGLMLLGLLFIT